MRHHRPERQTPVAASACLGPQQKSRWKANANTRASSPNNILDPRDHVAVGVAQFRLGGQLELHQLVGGAFLSPSKGPPPHCQQKHLPPETRATM